MASPQSRQLRATFAKDPNAVNIPVSLQRQAWEAAVEATNAALEATVTPLDLDGLAGESVASGKPQAAGVVLFLHGGGFNAGSCRTHRAMAANLSRALELPVVLVDYRLAPEHPFPAAVDDAVQAYHWLLRKGDAPREIVIGGDSDGGGLAMAALVNIRDDGAPLPAAAFLISPWVDLTLTGDTLETRRDLDPLTTYEGLHAAARYYIGDGNPRHPLASPVYADLRGLPPLLIQSGDHEILLSDATRLAEHARAAGVEVEIEVWDAMWHVWHAWAPDLPEAQEAIGRIAEFVRRHVASLQP